VRILSAATAASAVDRDLGCEQRRHDQGQRDDNWYGDGGRLRKLELYDIVQANGYRTYLYGFDTFGGRDWVGHLRQLRKRP